jgi:predicted DNA-binding transcriptional regulator YafY
VPPQTLTAIAAATRDHLRLRFDYESHGGATSVRVTEPHRLIYSGQRWYLVAWDVERQDWRTFRVDRLTPHTPTGPRFAAREPPEGDLIAYVRRGLGTATWRYRATVTVHAPAEDVQVRMPAGVQVTPAGPRRCVLQVGSDSPEMLAAYIGMIDADFTIDPEASPELAERLRTLAQRYTRATDHGRAKRTRAAGVTMGP